MGIIVFFVALLVVVMEQQKAAQKKRIKEAYTFNKKRVQGSARFATNDDLEKAGLFKRIGIFIGFSPDGRRKLFLNSAGHFLVVAGARTGKLVTLLVSAILTLPRKISLAVFDPKAEIVCIVGHFLKACGRDVYVVNPFGILLDRMKGLKQATFNPMASLDPKSRSFHADCDKLADAICLEEGHTSDPHWITSAGILISGVIAALARHGTPVEKTFVALRNVITGANGESIYDFCREAMRSSDPFIRQKLARFAAPKAEENKELNSIVSTADTQTAFIGNQAIAECLKGGANEVSCRKLKRDAGTVIFTCLPLDKLPVSKKFFRVMAASMISDTLNEGLRGKGARVLAVFDEVAQIGPLKILTDSLGMAAGSASLQFMLIYQNVGQMMAQFGQNNFQTAVANSSAAAYFGIRDPQSAAFVSTQCGLTEVLSQSRSVTIDIHTGEPVVNDSGTQTARPLLHPDEVRFGLRDDEMLLFCDGVPAVIRAKRKPYFRCPGVRGYRENPYYQKQSGALFSSLFSWLFE